MFSAAQIVAHLVGDYIIQSDWMAQRKTKESFAALTHAMTYGACFIPITQSIFALTVIISSHFLIDRFRLIRYLLWFKNMFAPMEFKYFLEEGLESGTGYRKDSPAWLSVWLMIIADNTLHIIINGLAIYYLG